MQIKTPNYSRFTPLLRKRSMCLLLNVNIPCKKQEQNFCPFSDMTLVANTRNLQFIST
ncbi:Na+/H+-dicarboxylate symporter [Vibrio cholerae TM 11079-80]|nr:Na+/H+-dicarboxylate symporter [Vibrio cholerae TM 11079-80]